MGTLQSCSLPSGYYILLNAKIISNCKMKAVQTNWFTGHIPCLRFQYCNLSNLTIIITSSMFWCAKACKNGKYSLAALLSYFDLTTGFHSIQSILDNVHNLNFDWRLFAIANYIKSFKHYRDLLTLNPKKIVISVTLKKRLTSTARKSLELLVSLISSNIFLSNRLQPFMHRKVIPDLQKSLINLHYTSVKLNSWILVTVIN